MNFARGLVSLCVLSAAWTPVIEAQQLGNCPAFPANNIWNTRVDTLPVHALSSNWVNSIGPTRPLHQDWGGPLYNGLEPGLQITYTNGTPNVPVNYIYPDESDPGPFPIPPTAKVEAGSDRHVLVVDNVNCKLIELFDAVKNPDNSWTASSGAVFDLRQNLLRPAFWTSADAAGLPIAGALPRYEEILAGEIRHALRFTAPRTRREFVWPGRHYASYTTDINLPPMGARFRLKADFDISRFSPTMQIILTALKRYGMMLADNGSAWYLTGAYDPRWPDLADEFRLVPGSAFEAVDVSSLMVDSDSAEVRGATAPATLSGASVSPSTVTGGQTTVLTVTLSGPAASGGTVVALTSDAASVPVPATVTVPQGQSSTTLTLTTSAVQVNTSAVVTATLAGLSRQASLTVQPIAPRLDSLAFSTTTVTGGQSASLVARLSSAAPTGGVTVTLGSSNQAVVQVPASVQIAAGELQGTVTVPTTTVQTNTAVNVTGSFSGVTLTAPITVNAPAIPALVSASLNPASVVGGQGAQLQVTLAGAAPTGGVTVTLNSANTAAAALPASVAVPAGATTASASVTTNGVGAVTPVILTATLSGVSRQATLTVNPPAVSSVTVNPTTVTGGTGVSGSVTLSGRAPSSGLTVSLSSSNTSAATVPVSVVIAGGQTSAVFTVSTLAVPTTTTVQVSATALGTNAAASLTVQAPAPVAQLSSVSAALNQAGTGLVLSVALNAPAPTGGLTVMVNSTLNGSIASVASLVNLPLTVAAGASTATATVPINRGDTNVTLTITATLAGITRSTSVVIPAAPPVSVTAITVAPTVSAQLWYVGTLTLSGPVTASTAKPVFSSTNGIQVKTPLLMPVGRSTYSFAYKATQSGTITVSLGGVTRTATVTVR